MFCGLKQRPYVGDDIAYCLLLMLTLGLWLALEDWSGLTLVGVVVILASACKGLIITFQFMEISRAPRGMQVIMGVWLLVVSTGIFYFIL